MHGYKQDKNKCSSLFCIKVGHINKTEILVTITYKFQRAFVGIAIEKRHILRT